MTTIQNRRRCSRACEACKKSKERCNGIVPCTLCTRRGKAGRCRIAGETRTDRESEHSARVDASTYTPSVSRDDNIDPSERLMNLIQLPDLGHFSRISHGVGDSSQIYIGDSSTLGLLNHVRRLAGELVGQCELTSDPINEIMLEPPLPAVELTRYGELVHDLNRENVDEIVECYNVFVEGVYDLYDDETLRHMVDHWFAGGKLATRADGSFSFSAVLLVIAIGAQQSRQYSDTPLAETFFATAYQHLSSVIIDPPHLGLVQELQLAVIYLLVVSRRNASFTLLGAAIRAAHAIGLHTTYYKSMEPIQHQKAAQRAWKCLRILDISSCASLGRPLFTTEDIDFEQRYNPDSATQPNILEPYSNTTDQQTDIAGLRLCYIAENILRTVYQERLLTFEFAQKISQYLRDWAYTLPDVLIDTEDSISTLPPLSEQLCRNHMTAAYYWTITLLTRPFLINDIHARKNGKVDQKLAHHETNSAQVFVDACIDSAFRCLDATMLLVRYPNLLKRLFLVVNTTMVSAMVLGLAVFGDYDKTFPLYTGLEKGERIFEHLSVGDFQAQQCLTQLRHVKAAAARYVRKRKSAELQRRGTNVTKLFGTVSQDRAGVALSQHNTNEAGQVGGSNGAHSATPSRNNLNCVPVAFPDFETETDSFLSHAEMLNVSWLAANENPAYKYSDQSTQSPGVFFSSDFCASPALDSSPWNLTAFSVHDRSQM